VSHRDVTPTFDGSIVHDMGDNHRWKREGGSNSCPNYRCVVCGMCCTLASPCAVRRTHRWKTRDGAPAKKSRCRAGQILASLPGQPGVAARRLRCKVYVEFNRVEPITDGERARFAHELCVRAQRFAGALGGAAVVGDVEVE